MTLFYPEEKILNHRIFDKFFVDYSVENLEKNLLFLAQLHYFGNHLEKKLDEGFKYRKGNSKLNPSKYKDFVGNINIYNLLIYNQETENYYFESDEENFEENYKLFKNQLILNLEQVYLPQFSFEKLIVSFLENDDEEYIKQSKFFIIDLNNKPNDRIIEKDRLENLEDINSYNHLYDLISNHKERYQSLNLDWFTDMGMSKKQFEHCNEVYSEDLRNKNLSDNEIRDLLKISIFKLIEKVYF